MAGPAHCLTCQHVERSHDEGRCASHCDFFVAPSTCPLGIAAHNKPKGHDCDCVPGQLVLVEIP